MGESLKGEGHDLCSPFLLVTWIILFITLYCLRNFTFRAAFCFMSLRSPESLRLALVINIDHRPTPTPHTEVMPQLEA